MRWVPRGLRKWLFALVAFALVALLFYKLRGSINLSGFHWSLLLELPEKAHLSLLLLSLLTIYVCYGIRAFRWTLFARSTGPANFWNIYSSMLMGFTCVFLFGRAGEPIRPLLIARKDKVPVPGTFGIYVLERVFDISATAVAAGLALEYVGRGVALSQDADSLLALARRAGSLLLIGSAAAILFLMYLRVHGAGALQSRLTAAGAARPWVAKLAVIFTGFTDGLHAIRNATDLGLALVTTFFHWLFNCFIYLWVVHSLGGGLTHFDFMDALLVMVFTMVGSAMQLPGVGGGSQLATFLVLTVLYGVEKETAAVAAIVIWLITFTAVSLAGLPMLLREGWSLGALRQLASEERRAEAAGSHVSAGAIREAEKPGQVRN